LFFFNFEDLINTRARFRLDIRSLFGFVAMALTPLAVNAQQAVTAASPGTAVAGNYSVVARGPNSRVWQEAVTMTNAQGDVSTNYHSYTELGTGACYTNDAGVLVDSVEQVESVAGGAQAIQGQYSVQWGQDNSTPITIQTPEGKQLTCQVYGLAYFDLSSGSNAAIARVQDSQGSILPPNQVLFQNAFSNSLAADILYTYTFAGLSQDIVFHQSPPAPDAYGLSDSNTVLQVYTKWINTADPVATAVTNENVVDDQVLSFGAMQMNVGNSLFFDGNGNSLSVSRVKKQWIHVSGSTYLVESLPWSAISNQVAQLHPASNLKPGRAVRGLAWLDQGEHQGKEEMARTKVAQVTKKSKIPAMKVAKADLGGKRFLIDYEVTLSSGSTVTLQGDTTYYVGSVVNVSSQLIIEGGAVVKYKYGGEINVTGAGSNIVCLTSPYRMAVFTSMNDNSVGTTISGSTGSPSQACTYISFSLQSTQSMTLRYLRFSYASTAVSLTVSTNGSGTDWIKFLDCQFYNCSVAISCDSDVNLMPIYVYNVLFSHVTYGIVAEGSNTDLIVSAENITADNMTSLTDAVSSSQVTATNCIFTAVTTPPGSSYRTDCSTASSGSTVYTNVVAGGYYLVAGSTNQAAGTTSIDPGLLADLATLTTYPPGVIQGTVSANTNLGTSVSRNTGTPDIGYHYPPFDWAINATVSATITIEPGTALCLFGSNYGISLTSTGAIQSTGTATSPVIFARYNTVEEQLNTNWEATNWLGSVYVAGGVDGASDQSTFTEWMVLACDYQFNNLGNGGPTFVLQNCQLYGGQICDIGGTILSTNCLYRRVALQSEDAGGGGPSNSYCNNLFWQGSVNVNHNGSGTWTYRDNLFDQVQIILNSGASVQNCWTNAYATNLLTANNNLFAPTNGSVILSGSPAYQTGTLGQYYYPTTETQLINAGSQSAAAAGLSSYTVTANNVADGTNTVSIGFHYLPVNIGPVITSEPSNISTSVGGSATFSVTATAGGAPMTYQWYFDGMPVSSGTGSSLTISSVVASNAGTYEVIVTDPIGSTASYLVTLKAAQNDFYVNYWNANAASPINPMLPGLSAMAETPSPARVPVLQAATNASMRGIEPGTFAQGYNWMRLTSATIGAYYTNGYLMNQSANYPPLTTLDILKNAYTNQAALIFTVNCLGDGYDVPLLTNSGIIYTNQFQVTNSSIAFLSSLASNWVRYANYIVQNYCWSNNLIVPYMGRGAPSISSNDYYLVMNLQSNWVVGTPGNYVFLPTLLTNTSFVSLPTVKYWEIGNEVETPMPTPYYAASNANLVVTNYLNLYTNIWTAMESAATGTSASIKIGPGFGNGFINGVGANTNIDPLLANTNVSMDFMVYHPYAEASTGYWVSNNINGLVTNLEAIWSWQDVERDAMYAALQANQRPFNIPVLATEWSGNGNEPTNLGITTSMWTLLADTETILAMAKGQQTLGGDYWFGADFYADWELLFSRFQSNLGNVFLSCSDGDGVTPQFWSEATTNTADGSTASPFRVYSTINTNNGTISVWMLNLQNTSNQTVDLHLPGTASSGTLFTLISTNSSANPANLTNLGYYTNITGPQFYGGTNFAWTNSSIPIAGSNAIVMTNPPATVSVAQFWLASTPPSPSPPTISGVPTMGQPGEIISITGANFSPNAQQNAVYFGAVKGIVTAATSTSLSVQVPYGASYGPISVTVSNLTAYSMGYFNPAYYGANVTNSIVMSGVSSLNPTNPFFATTNLPIHGIGFFDADGDGKGDLAYLAPYVAAIVENGSSGAGSFTLLSNSPYSLAVNFNPSAMAMGDLDGDGLLDWVVLINNLNELQIFRNASTPLSISFAMGGTYLTGNYPVDVKIADIDGDGRPDIIVANYDDNTVSVLRNISTGQGNIAFAQATNFSVCGSPFALAVGDIDGDGKPDIAVCGYVSSGSNVVVLRNTSTPGVISFSSPIAVVSANLPDAESIALGDFNGDGKLDIAVGSAGESEVYLCVNTSTPGSVSFNAAVGVAGVTDPRDIAIADLNGDGQLDFAVVDGSSDSFYTFQNTNTVISLTSFSGSSAYSAGSSGGADSIRIIGADIDNDGRPDLVVGDFNGTNVFLFRNVSQY
jgi:hypothetical protein